MKIQVIRAPRLHFNSPPRFIRELNQGRSAPHPVYGRVKLAYTNQHLSALPTIEEPLPGFNGAIDEMAFFNENVTEPERTALYDGGSGLYYNGSTWGPCGA